MSEKIVECYSLRDLIRKVEMYKDQGGSVDESSIRQTAETSFVFTVVYADNNIEVKNGAE